MLCFGSGAGGLEVGDEDRKQQAVDDEAGNGWGEDAAGALLGNAEEGDDTRNEAHEDEKEGGKIGDNG